LKRQPFQPLLISISLLLLLTASSCKKDGFTCHVTGRAVKAHNKSEGLPYATILYATSSSDFNSGLTGPSVQQSVRADANGNFEMDIPNCDKNQTITLYGETEGSFGARENAWAFHPEKKSSVSVPIKMISVTTFHIINTAPINSTDTFNMGPTGYPFYDDNYGIGAIDTFVCCYFFPQGFYKNFTWGVKKSGVWNDHDLSYKVPCKATDTITIEY